MKKILITGSTDGIGKLAAIKLAKDGHQLFLHGRNAEKLSTTIAEIKSETQNDAVSGFVSDFSDLTSVNEMAQEVLDQVDKLDVLVNNAGIFKTLIEVNQRGIDIRFAVNYLAPYHMTHKIVPLLQKSNGARIINLSSAAQAEVSIEALFGKQKLSSNVAYAQSKLALTMWSFYLAQQQDVSVIALNPGSLLQTKMVMEAYGKSWSSADKGANIIYDLSVSSEYDGVTGKYFDNDKGEIKGMFSQAHVDSYDEQLVQELIINTDKLISELINE